MHILKQIFSWLRFNKTQPKKLFKPKAKVITFTLCGQVFQYDERLFKKNSKEVCELDPLFTKSKLCN